MGTYPGSIYLLRPYGDGFPSSERSAAISSIDGLAEFAGGYPAVQGNAECSLVCCRFLLGRRGFSRGYGVLSDFGAAAFSGSRPIERSGTGTIPNLAGIYPGGDSPGDAEKAAAGIRAGHPHGNGHLCHQCSGLPGCSWRTVSSGYAGCSASHAHDTNHTGCGSIHPREEKPGILCIRKKCFKCRQSTSRTSRPPC